MMKSFMKALLGMALAGCLAFSICGVAEESTILLGEADDSTVTAGEPFVAGSVVELTAGETVVVDSYGDYSVNRRNQYLVLPMHVMNLSFEDIRVSETFSVGLNYHEYSFGVLPISRDDASDTLGMLEESDYDYVFRLPNVIIRNLSECVVTIMVGAQEYTLAL